MITVRLISRADEDALVDMAREACAELTPWHDFSEAQVRRTVMRAALGAHPAVFVAEDGGEIVGILAATINDFWFASGIFVSQDVIYVRPVARGSRAAVKLIREFMRWGEMLKAKEIHFGTSTGYEPERLARLATHCGAERVGVCLRKVC